MIGYHTGLGTANKFDDYIENINIKPNFALLWCKFLVTKQAKAYS